MKSLKTLLMLIVSLLVIACTANGPIHTAQLDEEDYGIGGTGIVGTVTGFGSIFINGVEVEITDKTQLTFNGASVKEHQFSIGETVEILAIDDSDYTLAAKANIRHEIIGPITGYDSTNNSLEILGHEVLLQNSAPKFELGQIIAVSGYTNQKGTIHARHIEVKDTDTIILRGNLQHLRARLALSGYPLSSLENESVNSGPVKILAKLGSNSLAIQRIDPESVLPFTRIRHWKLEGFSGKYSSEWPELESSNANNPIGEPLQFELNLDEQGNATIHRLDSKNLPRGNSNPRRTKTMSQSYPRNQSSGSTRSTRGGRGHR